MFKEKNIENRKLRNLQKQNSDIVKIEGLYKNDSSLDESNNFHLEELLGGEGTTKYGEFVSSYFAWIGLNRQKNRADELNEMTRKKYTSKKFAFCLLFGKDSATMCVESIWLTKEVNVYECHLFRLLPHFLVC